MKDEYNTIFSHNGLKRESKTTIDKIFQAGQIFDVDLHNKDIGITVEYQTVYKWILDDHDYIL